MDWRQNGFLSHQTMQNKTPHTPRLAITGFGLVTSVGLTALSSTAAIRAGISRFQETEQALVFVNGNQTELQGATVARVPIASQEIIGVDRALALMVPALKECIERSGLNTATLGQAEWRIENLIEEENLNSALLTQNFNQGLYAQISTIPPNALLNNTNSENLRHCAVFEQIIQIAELLCSGKKQVALIGCVDSLSTYPMLERLHEAGRLKDATRPDGMIPGEAAGAISIETEDHAKTRGAKIFAFLQSWGQGMEPNPWISAKPSKAEGLTTAFHAALAGLDDGGESNGLVISDLNGERQRALEWALTDARVFSSIRNLWHPADCVGDCGGATGVLQIVVGVLSLAKSYAGTRRIAMTTSDDAGARRVLCIEKA